MSNPIKPTVKSEILPVLMIILSAAAGFYFYAHFPDRVPIHWNIAGQPDNYGSKITAAFVFPAVILGMYVLFMALPYLDPRKQRYVQFSRVYHIFKNILVMFMALIYFLSGLNSLGYNLPVEKIVPILVGVLFMILGNYMGKIKPNWFMGIRTPWTLSSEEAWNKTHRFAGKIFILSGLLIALTGVAPVVLRLPLFLAAVFIAIFGTIVYSFLVYRKEKKK